MLNTYLDSIGKSELKVKEDVQVKGNQELVENSPTVVQDSRETALIQQEQSEFNDIMAKSPLNEMKTPDDLGNLMSKFTLVEDRGPGESRYFNPDTNESIILKSDESGNSATLTYNSGELTHTIRFVDGKFSEGKIETKAADGTGKVYSYEQTADGVKLAGVKNNDMAADIKTTQKEELQNIIESSPIAGDTIPTEDELIKLGYTITGQYGNGDYTYFEKAETGEKIMLPKIKHAKVYTPAELTYTKGDIKIKTSYSHIDGAAYGTGTICKQDENGNEKIIGEFNKKKSTGQFEFELENGSEVTLAEIQEGPIVHND